MSDHDVHPEAGHRHENRLAHETSPYLLQHAHNPVDWYPWGEEALARARRDDKPILLSIGYAACHWCHVMAHESFENDDIARLMNELFVCIKVDREERPDLDALYMEAVQALTGRGGWPMTVFLTPDGAPFYGGTYFPPQDRYGMPGFPTVLKWIAESYRTRRDEVERQAQAFREFYQHQSARKLTLPAGLDLSSMEMDASLLDAAADRLLAQIDALHGGFGRAPKFPQPMALEFLLRVESRRRESGGAAQREPELLRLVRLTLDAMADGGVYDQVGGGFHRYSTDERWLVPHFEKMLYDNALLARAYLAAWQMTGDERYRRVCTHTLDYVLREMTDPEGGFYATQDADSEGVEGKFYVWSRDELRSALGEDDFAVIERLWGVTERGNFEGHNILHGARSVSEVAAELELSPDHVADVVQRARATLYAVRAQRVWPGRDDKILAGWNGLMLRAMADAGRILDRADYRAAAEANATFLLAKLTRDGRLLRTWRQGQAKVNGFLEDYAAVASGLLSTYEATGRVRWFVEARRLADAMVERFWDASLEGFFDVAGDHETLVGRPRELTDNATPSGTSLAVELLLRLSALTGALEYRERAARVALPLSGAAAEQPSAFAYLLCGLDDLIGPMREIALVGAPDSDATRALMDVLNARFLPRDVLARAAPDDQEALSVVPLLEGRAPVDARPTAYVCRDFACQMPVTQPADLAAQLDAAS
ncbi:MAG TPA: thioredoxin domain-containing protein [Ktedonobacterales bacterium]